MSRRKIEFPAKGHIKATGASVTIHGQSKLAGIEVYYVEFEDGFRCDWGRDKVIVNRGA